MTEHETAPTAATTNMPTFEQAISTAWDALGEARACVGMESTGRLTAVADSYLLMAQLIDRRERGLE